MSETTYKDAGVDTDLGNDASKILFNAARLSWENRRGNLGEIVELSDDFSGLRGIHIGELRSGTYMGMNFDGVGTKIEIAERRGKHETCAFDLFEMVCGDCVSRGAEPILVGSILDVNSLGRGEQTHIGALRQLAKGYLEAAREANVAIINGEVAELGARVRGYGDGFNYNWGAGVVWITHKDRLLDGRKIKSGDFLVALQEDGFRSNGLSLVRRVMEDKYGKDWHETPWKKTGKTFGDVVLTPSKVYTAAIVEMVGTYNHEPKVEIHGIAHITGGGIPEKLGRVLRPSGFGAAIEDPIAPHEFMLFVQEQGEVKDRVAYRTFNMGTGMIVITPEPHEVCLISEKYGIKPKVIGTVTKGREIVIKNKGFFSRGQYLSYLV